MKRIIPLLIILLASAAYGSRTDEWIKYLENPRWCSDELKSKNYKAQYLHNDFSQLLMPRSKFLGYIDPNYKRINIHFKSINKTKPDTYYVKGTSGVGKNICDFEGQIVIKQIREFKKMHGCDDEFKNAGFKGQGVLLGEYKFKENSSQKSSGVFEGMMALYWLIDNNNKIEYNDIYLSGSDNYYNNQYIGTWKKYGSKLKKTCNWGEYRIPFSDDLDYGAGEFGVNPKYYKQGWEEFKQ